MSAHDSHTGPVKTPAQLAWLSFFSFVIPVFVIIGLVHFVIRSEKPAVDTVDAELAKAERIQKVGSVRLYDPANPPADEPAGASPVVAAAAPAAQTAEGLYNAACAACHAAGVAGAPKFGDAAAWGPRISTGIDALVASVVNGKGAMPPKGGSSASEAEIKASVEYMVNAAK